jgi:hypothetical protein
MEFEEEPWGQSKLMTMSEIPFPWHVVVWRSRFILASEVLLYQQVMKSERDRHLLLNLAVSLASFGGLAHPGG